MSEKRLKPHQFAWIQYLICVWCVCMLFLGILSVTLKKGWCFIGLAVMLGIGVLYMFAIRNKVSKLKHISMVIEDFIRNNKLYQSHNVIRRTLFWERDAEIIDYYPQVTYTEIPCDNVFRLKFRLDGTAISQRFRELEQPLADMFCTVCTDRIEERGFITYCFELQEQKQIRIESQNDVPITSECEITFSDSLSWNWKKTPHLLLTGNTGSGKTQLAQYIIACLLAQGVRVIYCDPKNDDDMRYFLHDKPVIYATKENEIASIVREIEEEVRLREKDLENIGIPEAEFNPVFLMFDELIAFSKIASKKTYEETAKRLAGIVVTGRSKRIYAGLILQRPDTTFIEGAVRDNLACKICMGQMSETAYTMSFGSDFTHVKNYRREIGSGLIYRQGIDTKPRELIAPFICNGALNRM